MIDPFRHAKILRKVRKRAERAEAELERRKEELRALTTLIADACLEASSTQRSWKHRCYAIMGALGQDYGDPDSVMPDDQTELERLKEELRARTTECEVRRNTCTRRGKRIAELEAENNQLRKIYQLAFALCENLRIDGDADSDALARNLTNAVYDLTDSEQGKDDG